MATETFDPRSVGATFATEWRRVMTEPVAFFQALPDTGELGPAMRFLAICAGIDALGAGLVSWSAWVVIGTFLGVIVGAVILAALVTLIAQQLLGGRAGFEPVMRAVAYAAAPAVFFWVPWVRAVAFLWAIALQVLAVQRAQGFDGLPALATTGAALAGLLVLRAGACG
jgi:hypothetical protein